MKIFITGITGFVGASAANYFVSAGHDVQGIGRKAVLPSNVSVACRYSSMDIINPIPEIDADIVIHSAALASDTASFKESYNVNVRGTGNVLYASRNVKHFIYISSSSVYNFNEHKVMCESDSGATFNRLSPYGQTKWLAEEAIRNSHDGIKKSILRPRAIYGKYDQLLIPRLLKLVRGNRIIVPDHLTRQISLTHVSNLMLAINLCIRNQQEDYGVFNVSDSEIYDLNLVLPALLKVVLANRLQTVRIPAAIFDFFIALNKRLQFNTVLNPFAASSLTNRSVIDIDKITHQLGYRPVNNFYNSCTEIAEWIHKEQGWKNFFKVAPAPNF
jgi:nucleoside-diphosphate-sugar epimerase